MTLPLRAQAYLWLVALGAVGTLTSWWLAWRGPLPANVPLMALLVTLAVVSQHFPLMLTPRQKVDVSIAVYFAALLLFGPPVGIVVVGLGQLVGQSALILTRNPATGRRRGTLLSAVFNTSQLMVATGLAAVVYYAQLPELAPAPLERVENVWVIPATAATMYLANSLIVAVMVGLHLGQNPAAVWLPGRRKDAIQFAALFLIGFLTARSASQDPWLVPVMALPTVIIYLSLKRSLQLVEQTVSAVEAMADVVDRRDPYTCEHSRRVAEYAVQIGRRMGLAGDDLETLRLAARVHDLGKIGVPDQILSKDGPLTPDERLVMERHVQAGCEILGRFSQYQKGLELVRSHHERLDGAGYPRGLKGDQIPLGGQIIAVADTLDAMTSDRPYRRALSLEQAIAELRRGKEAHWRADVVEAADSLLSQEGSRMLIGSRLAAPA